MIQDQINIGKTINALRLKCYACCQIGHLINNCNKLHYIPDIEKVIKTNEFSKPQQRNPEISRVKFKKHYRVFRLKPLKHQFSNIKLHTVECEESSIDEESSDYDEKCEKGKVLSREASNKSDLYAPSPSNLADFKIKLPLSKTKSRDMHASSPERKTNPDISIDSLKKPRISLMPDEGSSPKTMKLVLYDNPPAHYRRNSKAKEKQQSGLYSMNTGNSMVIIPTVDSTNNINIKESVATKNSTSQKRKSSIAFEKEQSTLQVNSTFIKTESKGLDRVHNFKNFFPEHNFKEIQQNYNQKITWTRFNRKKKLLIQKLSQYTFKPLLLYEKIKCRRTKGRTKLTMKKPRSTKTNKFDSENDVKREETNKSHFVFTAEQDKKLTLRTNKLEISKRKKMTLMELVLAIIKIQKEKKNKMKWYWKAKTKINLLVESLRKLLKEN